MPFTTPDEWAIAHTALDARPVGTKLKYSPQTSHSFIKLNDGIWAIDRALFGHGGNGKIKAIENEAGESRIVKIGTYEMRSRELRRFRDVGWFSTQIASQHAIKYYSPMENLGTDLHHCLLDNPDDNMRFHMGLELCLAVYRLHNGLQSQSGTIYIHGDIKPENAVLDRAGKMRLIDMDCLKQDVGSIPDRYTGTYVYCPEQNFILNRMELDIIALKRTLFYPRDMLSAAGRHHSQREVLPGIFTPDMLDASGLDVYINTSSERKPTPGSYCGDNCSSGFLTALLLRARYDLPVSCEQLQMDPVLCHLLIAAYEEECGMEDMHRIARGAVLPFMRTSVEAGEDVADADVAIRFLAARLKLSVTLEQVPLLRQVLTHHLLPYWSAIIGYDNVMQTFFTSAPEPVMTAVRTIFDGTCHETYRRLRLSLLRQLCCDPSLADAVSVNVVATMKLGPCHPLKAYAENHRLECHLIFQSLFDAVRHTLSSEEFETLTDVPGLTPLLYSPFATVALIYRLRVALQAGDNLAAYRERIAVITLWYQRAARSSLVNPEQLGELADLVDPARLGPEEITLLWHCDRVLLLDQDFATNVPKLLWIVGQHPDLASSLNYLAARGDGALLRALNLIQPCHGPDMRTLMTRILGCWERNPVWSQDDFNRFYNVTLTFLLMETTPFPKDRFLQAMLTLMEYGALPSAQDGVLYNILMETPPFRYDGFLQAMLTLMDHGVLPSAHNEFLYNIPVWASFVTDLGQLRLSREVFVCIIEACGVLHYSGRAPDQASLDLLTLAPRLAERFPELAPDLRQMALFDPMLCSRLRVLVTNEQVLPAELTLENEGLVYERLPWLSENRSRTEFFHLARFVSTAAQIDACQRFCEHLDALKQRRDNARIGSRIHASLNTFLADVTRVIAERVNGDALNAAILPALQVAAPVLGRNRGLLAGPDRLLRILSGLLCLTPAPGNATPYTFFQPRSHRLAGDLSNEAQTIDSLQPGFPG